MTKWNESTNPPEKKPLSDLQKRGLEAAEQRKSDRLERSIKRLKQEPDYPAKVISYDAVLGVYNVQKGSDIYQARSITNGAIAPGDNVALKPGTGSTALIDQMWVPKKKKVEESTSLSFGKIMYAYTTIGDAPDTTALYVAGFKNRKSIKIEEWSNDTSTSGDNIGEPTYILGMCCLDNLGGDNFVVSYTMTRFDNNGNGINSTFKCAKKIGNTFSITISTADLGSLASGGFNGEIGQIGYFVGSIGFGNWITNNLRDLAVLRSGGTTITTSESIRLSDTSLNTSIGSIQTRQSYSSTHVSTPITGGGSAISLTCTYPAYLSPTFSISAQHSYTSNNSGLFRAGRYYQAVRYNPRLDKGIYSATEYDLDWVGMGLYRGGSANTTPFMQSIGPSGSNTRLPVVTNYQCIVSLTANSTAAIVQSGVIPSVGTAISGLNIRIGTYIVDVNGSTLTLSKTASGTAVRTIFWGFPSTAGGTPSNPYTNINRFTGTNIQCDIQAGGLSIIYLGDFVVRFGGTNTVMTEKIRTPVSFYADDFSYRRTDLVDVYPPDVVKKNAQNQDVFLILAASYG